MVNADVVNCIAGVAGVLISGLIMAGAFYQVSYRGSVSQRIALAEDAAKYEKQKREALEHTMNTLSAFMEKKNRELETILKDSIDNTKAMKAHGAALKKLQNEVNGLQADLRKLD